MRGIVACGPKVQKLDFVSEWREVTLKGVDPAIYFIATREMQPSLKDIRSMRMRRAFWRLRGRAATERCCIAVANVNVHVAAVSAAWRERGSTQRQHRGSCRERLPSVGATRGSR